LAIEQDTEHNYRFWKVNKQKTDRDGKVPPPQKGKDFEEKKFTKKEGTTLKVTTCGENNFS